MSIMKKVMITFLSLCVFSAGFSQKYFTKTGQVSFDATAPSSPEKIEAINRAGTCVVDTKSGNMQFAVLIKGFSFERALMEEHFNENYLESDKYQKAEFKGELKDVDKVDFSKDGSYTLKVKGKLTMHGLSKEVETDAKLQVQGGKLKANAGFTVALADYAISIPGLVADKIAKTARISISCQLEPLK